MKTRKLVRSRKTMPILRQATDKDIKLKKGTPISELDIPMNQGIIVVKAKVGGEWIQGEIQLDETTCNDEQNK